MKGWKTLLGVASFWLGCSIQTFAKVNVSEEWGNSVESVLQRRSVRVVSPHQNLKINFVRCVGSGNTVVLELEVTKRGDDLRINVGSVSNVAIDNLGKQYKLEYSVGGAKWRSGYSSQPELFMTNVPVSVCYRISKVPEQTKMFKTVSLKFHSPQVSMSSEPVKIINVPISRDEDLAEIPTSPEDIKEDFIAFEKNFVSDADFQMSRIIFHDLGYKFDDDPEAEGIRLSPDNWTLFKNTFDDVRKLGQYKTNMILTADRCVQTIWIEDSSFLLEYTYTRINGKWYLTKVFERG